MKKILIIGGVVFLFVLVAAGAFWGGMTYQSNQASQTLARFESARGQVPEGFFPGNSGGFAGGSLPEGQAAGNFANRGTSGQIKAVNGGLLTLSTALDVTTVNLTENTQVEKTVAGELADLEPGVRVLITGQQDDNGVITADRIQIMSGDMLVLPEMPPAEQEP